LKSKSLAVLAFGGNGMKNPKNMQKKPEAWLPLVIALVNLASALITLVSKLI